jgi:glucose-1-phosphate thymidylyltransferase
MKAVILAAGKGTRLYPVTLTMPKPLVPVANKALIRYAIETLTNMGATEIGLVVNSVESPIRESLGDGISTVGVPLTYIEQTNPRGLAHAIGLCEDYIGNEPFIVYLGDNIFQDSMRALYRRFEETGASAALALTQVPNPSAFGIAALDGERITYLVEKPDDPPSDLAIAGVYVFRPEIFYAIKQIKPSPRGEYEITDAIQYLLEQGGTIIPYVVEGWWIDAGKPHSIILANQLVLEGTPFTPTNDDDDRIEGNSTVSHRVTFGQNTRIIDSEIRGPVTIGNNVIIRDAYIGPYTSIGDNVVIECSEIEHSIVMKGCVIRDIDRRIDTSLIAENAQVIRATSKPQTHRFVLAENTMVQL